jgi:hypothetical protein
MLRIPWTFNIHVVIHIDNIALDIGLLPPSFSLWTNLESWGFFRIITQGLKINLMLRDDTQKWSNDKIDLLKLIEVIKNRLDK